MNKFKNNINNRKYKNNKPVFLKYSIKNYLNKQNPILKIQIKPTLQMIKKVQKKLKILSKY